MAVLIGHASISEKGTINGTRGDSTGREVCTREWYPKDWDAVLRPKTKTLAENSAKACEDGVANNNIGYGQNDRNTAYNSFKKVGSMKKIEKSNTDCSAFMTLCAIAGGCSALNYSGNAPTTSTMIDKFKATGQYEVLTDSKYLKSDAYLTRGDILVKKGSHTVMVLSNGSKVGTSSTQGTQSGGTEVATNLSKSLAGTYVVTATSLNIRKGAGTKFASLGTLKKGTKVTCFGYYSVFNGVKWLYVVADGITGFCSSNYLKKK